MRALTLLLLAGCSHLGLESGEPTGVDGGVDLTSVDLTSVDLARVDLTQPNVWTVPDVPCGPALPRYSGTLCGPSPCTVARNDVVDATNAFRNDAPDLTIGADGQPIILYSSATGVFAGHLATLTATGWKLETTPQEVATGALALDGSGELHMMEYEGNTFADYVHRGASWSSPEQMADTFIAAGQLVADSGGCLYATALSNENGIVGQRKNGAWSWGWLDRGVEPYYYDRPALALGSDGRPQAAYWANAKGDSTGKLWWALLPGPPEAVTTYNLSYGQDSGRLRLAVAGTQPHLLFVDDQRLRYATRAPGWTLQDVAVGESVRTGDCDVPVDGGQCVTHAVGYLPIDVVASEGGDVRLLYARNEINGVEQWSCQHNDTPDLAAPGPQCVLMELSWSTVGRIEMAWPGAGGVSSAVIADGLVVVNAHARLDAQGTLHIAGYLAGSATNSTVQYLAIKP